MSSEIKVGCKVYNHNGNIIAPHTGCVNAAELGKSIEKIRTNHFLSRLYTANELYSIDREMHKLHIAITPSLQEIFSKVENLTHNKIRDVTIDRLDILFKRNDDETR